MTKTEKTLIDLCELVDAYFQMQQTVVKSAIESQLKEMTKEIVDEITNKKKVVKTDTDFKVGDLVECIDGKKRQIVEVLKNELLFEKGFVTPKEPAKKIKVSAQNEIA